MYRPPPNVSPPPLVKLQATSIKKPTSHSLRKTNQPPVSFTWQQSLTELPPVVASSSPQGADLDPPPPLHRVLSMGNVEHKLHKVRQNGPSLRSVSPSGGLVPPPQMTSTFSGASHAHIRAAMPKHSAAPTAGMEILSSRAPRAPLNEGKQWEFKILSSGPSAGGGEVPLAGDEEGSPKLERLPIPARHHFKPNGVRGTEVSINVELSRKKQHNGKSKQQSSIRSLPQGSIRPPEQTAPHHSATSVVDIPLHIEGNALNAEVVAASSALLSLEACVARERRAKEELAASHKQVLIAFRQVVSTFLSSVVDPTVAEGRSSNKLLHVSVAKCSVVVHTLVTTIQSYVRQRLSQEIRELRRGGQHTSLAARLHLSNKGSVPMSLCLDDLAASATCESPGSHETPHSTRSSLHDVVFDNETIARLRQLYFDYYDCETFVLPSQNGGSPPDSVQVLPMEERSMRHAIEESNVLLEHRHGGDDVVDRDRDEFPYDLEESYTSQAIMEEILEEIPEEIPESSTPKHYRPSANEHRGPHHAQSRSVGSLRLNDARAMRDIFGSPHSASNLQSPSSEAPSSAYHNSTNRFGVEDL